MRPCNHRDCAFHGGCLYSNCTHASRCGGGVCIAPDPVSRPEPTEANTFASKADISFLRTGDRILVQETGRDVYRIAVVAMNGHKVSETYGTRTGNTYYNDPAHNYINVKFDGETYTVVYPNNSIYERTHTVYVTKEVAARITRDKRETARMTRLSKDRAQITVLENRLRNDAAALAALKLRVVQAERDFPEE